MVGKRFPKPDFEIGEIVHKLPWKGHVTFYILMAVFMYSILYEVSCKYQKIFSSGNEKCR